MACVTAIVPVITSSDVNQPQAANSAVTNPQSRQPAVNTRPQRNARRRRRSSRARGSMATLIFCATRSAKSPAVSTPRCSNERHGRR
ncbi:Uncharacterised protein [Mycobacterium tuberculosis]|uniref:Uncharacterized protein n=1 Tax=Mycobacterium tuberculosis TaxID=1773 RepID=A0A0U0RRS9_MYCTX|nr:Uncharacterised protein [Mycobacterium tuberculosis]COW84332.1 Uncharacterised protein [Mycobacterium tuberculosis]